LLHFYQIYPDRLIICLSNPQIRIILPQCDNTSHDHAVGLLDLF
jgi:hypothetical protein